MNPFQWADPTSIEQAIDLTVNGAAIKAGGIDLLDLMKDHIASPTRLVNIRRLPNLDQITEDDKGITIGPLVTLAQLGAHPILNKKYTAIAQAAGGVFFVEDGMSAELG